MKEIVREMDNCSNLTDDGRRYCIGCQGNYFGLYTVCGSDSVCITRINSKCKLNDQEVL